MNIDAVYTLRFKLYVLTSITAFMFSFMAVVGMYPAETRLQVSASNIDIPLLADTLVLQLNS